MPSTNFDLKILVFIGLSALIISGCGTSKKLETRNSKINTVIKTARGYAGVPYQWGGTSSRGMDCSGLLLKSFESINYPIPRTALEQSKFGKKVSIDQLQPGDLVFFAAGKRKGKLTHAGLVTDVRSKNDIRFIHASSSKGVIEVNLMSRYYQGIFKKAVRVEL
ncbi:MAG: C40 family peptidase [Cyclobacteriaceae bacterium]